MKILIDTDIGSDIDDALALTFLLSQPSIEILGITTVTAEATRRAMLASAIVCHAGRSEIPIIPGAEVRLDGQPHVRKPRGQPAPQAKVLDRGRWPFRSTFGAQSAVGF